MTPRQRKRFWFSPDRPNLYALQILLVFYTGFAVVFYILHQWIR